MEYQLGNKQCQRTRKDKPFVSAFARTRLVIISRGRSVKLFLIGTQQSKFIHIFIAHFHDIVAHF